MLCCCEVVLCLLCNGCAARTDPAIEVGHTWLTVRRGLMLDAQGDESDKLMGKLVKVALNRRDESLSRVGMPSWRVELRCRFAGYARGG